MYLVENKATTVQPPLYTFKQAEIPVLLTSLSIGGAEYIVLDWAARIYPRWRIHLILIKDQKVEWPLPSHIRVTRLHNERVIEKLEQIGRTLAAAANPVCLCHLASKPFRDALRKGGAEPIPVLHNARAGWPEGTDALSDARYVISVSEACALELRGHGWTKPIAIIRHLPSVPHATKDARVRFREAWNIPHDATVIGMIGAAKPQKNYQLALRIFKELLTVRDAYLVIVGGPVNTREGPAYWNELVRLVHELGLRSRTAMPGFIPFATTCLPAFDVVLNTSLFEGFSIATAETLASGLPVIASAVGGQGEVPSPGLALLPLEADEREWASVLHREIGKRYETPPWVHFPSCRLWTLASLVREPAHTVSGKTLFVTANLNAGGAQRSLVNLCTVLKQILPLEVAVTTASSTSYFLETLEHAGVPVTLLHTSWDTFSFAEALIEKVCTEGFETLCFWNLHAQVRLLLVKALASTKVRIIEVSPGGYGFEEIEEAAPFSRLIAFPCDAYYGRLDQLVLKYRGDAPKGCALKTSVIQNGVPLPKRRKYHYHITDTPRIVVSGRLAPSKFIREIAGAMIYVWELFPKAELHFYGAAESADHGYMETVMEYIGEFEEDTRRRIFFHGPDFDIRERLYNFDLYVVLGKNQGCPNALLEALAAGLPCIANNDGGTAEQVIHEKTGLLIHSRGSRVVGQAIVRVLKNERLRARIGRAGRRHIARHFSMGLMIKRYAELFIGKKPEQKKHVERKVLPFYGAKPLAQQ